MKTKKNLVHGILPLFQTQDLIFLSLMWLIIFHCIRQQSLYLMDTFGITGVIA